MSTDFPAYEVNQYSREELVETLKRIHAQYPHTFKWFFMEELRNQMTIISEEDAEYLKGEPAPLKITIPVEIEKDDEQDP